MVLLEAAVESLARARRAVDDGAQRLELCACLSMGGLTPSVDLIHAVRAAVDVPLHVLIRPRGGDFVYAARELETMCLAMRAVREAGADAAVVGALDARGSVDRSAIVALRRAAGPLPLVAHRAVDAARDLDEAVEAMASLGISRVLTSGGAPTAEQGLVRLAALVRRVGAHVTILAGGSVRAANVRRVVMETGVSEIHVGFPDEAEDDRVGAVAAELSFGGE